MQVGAKTDQLSSSGRYLVDLLGLSCLVLDKSRVASSAFCFWDAVTALRLGGLPYHNFQV